MPLPDQTPKLPKLPFLVGDAALVATAWFISDRAAHPWPAEAVLAVAGCVFAGAVVGVIPFLTDYARRQDEALDDRQRGLEALARTVATSAEQISIAAQGLHEIAELAQKNLKQAEQLPHKLQEKIVGLQERVAGSRDQEKEEMERELVALRTSEADRIEAAVDKLAKAAAEWTKAEAAAQKRLAAVAKDREETVPSIAPSLEEKTPETEVGPGGRARPLAPSSPDVSSNERSGAAARPYLDQEQNTEISPVPIATEVTVAPPAPAAKIPRKPRKPKVEAPPSAPEEPEAQPELPVFPAAAPSEFSQADPDEAAPANALSTDGATRLIVTAYIGIGNRIFIRGDGPGLSWEKGVPLQFVSIGKWRWEAADATAPIRFKLYKNDDLECTALGERSLEAGRQQEVTAAF